MIDLYLHYLTPCLAAYCLCGLGCWITCAVLKDMREIRQIETRVDRWCERMEAVYGWENSLPLCTCGKYTGDATTPREECVWCQIDGESLHEILHDRPDGWSDRAREYFNHRDTESTEES